MRPTRAITVSLAVLAGVVVGWRLAGRHLDRHKADLFANSRLKRGAALSYLAGQDSPEIMHVLREYIAWEPSATLRRRAQRVLKRMKRGLESSQVVA